MIEQLLAERKDKALSKCFFSRKQTANLKLSPWQLTQIEIKLSVAVLSEGIAGLNKQSPWQNNKHATHGF